MITRKAVIDIVLEGISGFMSDAFRGMTTQLNAQDKMYLGAPNAKGQRPIVFPVINMISYLTAVNTASAPKILYPPKQYKEMAHAFASSIIIEGDSIPFTRDGKPILFGEFKPLTKPDPTSSISERDPLSGCFVLHNTARLEKGVPNPKIRPVLPTPWTLAFQMTVVPSKVIDIADVQRMFEDGGRLVAIGTFRPLYGKFALAKFDVHD